MHLQLQNQFLILVLAVLLRAAASDHTSPYIATDVILLNCGSSSNQTSQNGRQWEGDDGRSKFASATTLQNTSLTIPSTASTQDPSTPQTPYTTARLFLSTFTYTFPVSAGPKFLRLYFHPDDYSGRQKTLSYFSVIANGHTLLRNFSAFLTVSAIKPPAAVFVKEFVVQSGDDQQINVTFVPSSGSYAFVNGIEIVSMPNSLYFRGPDYGYTSVGSSSVIYFPNSTFLETVYRLNVGGRDITPEKDSGMFRTWQTDQDYVFGSQLGLIPRARQDVKIRYSENTPAYTAPEVVYQTSRVMGGEPAMNLRYNLTWLFEVDSGFNYLVRLHFCETQKEVVKMYQRLFYIYINNQTAEAQADVILMSGGNGIPVYRDYVVFVPGNEGKLDLWLDLHPNADTFEKAEFYDVLLNGAEIFKLSKSDGSLAGPNPELVTVPPPPEPTAPERRKAKSATVVLIVATLGSLLAVLFLALCFFAIWRRRRAMESGTSKANSSWVPLSYKSSATSASSLPCDLCRYFSIGEIKAATHDFDEKFIIGSGGFGNVYKGFINVDGASSPVAIKRSTPSSRQGVNEFETEIKMLSKLRHVHLVALIGYCDAHGEMILVYEYMPRGTLRDHLYKTQNQPLSWKRRLEICIGAARGLQYLHTGAKHVIIHRDVKTTNILLDEKWVAKFSDFGLSKLGPESAAETHVSTLVKGSIGYVDPEYYRRQQLTEKSDVYSFGVVLYEVLCARPAMVMGIPKEKISLAVWGHNCSQMGTLHEIIDPHLKGQIAPECLLKYGEVAQRCVSDQGIKRPTMSDVVWALEFALQLQDTAEKNINSGYTFDLDGAPPSPLSSYGGLRSHNVNIEDDMFSDSCGKASNSKSNTTLTIHSTDDSNRLFKSANVFSEIMNPSAR